MPGHVDEARSIATRGPQSRPLVLATNDIKGYPVYALDPATAVSSEETGIFMGYDGSRDSGSTSMGTMLKPLATARRRVQCSRVVVGQFSEAWLRVVRIAMVIRSALWVLGTALGASVAILIAFWSLFPVCTRCRDSVAGMSRREGSALAGPTGKAMALAASEITANSTLRINQLQVNGSRISVTIASCLLEIIAQELRHELAVLSTYPRSNLCTVMGSITL